MLKRPSTHDRWLESRVMTNIVLATLACIITRPVLRRALPYALKDMPRDLVDDRALHTRHSSTSTIWNGRYRTNLADEARRLPQVLPVLLRHGERDTTAPLDGAR